MAVCSHPPYYRHGGLYPRRPRPAKLAVAPQGSPSHPGGPGPTPHRGDPDPPSPTATCAGQGHEAPMPTVPDNPGTPQTDGMHQPLAKPAQTTLHVAPPCSPQGSPLRPFTHPQPDHCNQSAPGTETGQHSSRTPKPLMGSMGSAGTRSPSRTPPYVARRVDFHDDTNNSQD